MDEIEKLESPLSDEDEGTAEALQRDAELGIAQNVKVDLRRGIATAAHPAAKPNRLHREGPNGSSDKSQHEVNK